MLDSLYSEAVLRVRFHSVRSLVCGGKAVFEQSMELHLLDDSVSERLARLKFTNNAKFTKYL